ncbi:alkaline shock response membrane anchor protein AmaP [Amycolatopsis sp. PS_44_ISF1]|uniref:alkaline shock response membrane anchor protein AmaP n=1 Tax=Amycolatopsis sp. PS_44_ISF1 TaxID=2974917 RepID=UPI0028DF58F3|nr:alkaline shock response membrane anchor protein AmaP [Amycolatopsis sp. PS_44_ISF1]MDT8910020.1 alkaline shock response membrane anchor protein AmaP [Amycolatopsis sp. PS_44_ISF1]
MTDLNRPARLNRGLLVVLGVVLLAAGAFVVLTHFRKLTLLRPDSPLVPGTDLPPTWVLYVVAAAAVVIGLLTLRWLAAQLTHKPRTQDWRFERNPDEGTTKLAANTAVEPFVAELAACPGVHDAHATLAGPRSAPRLAAVLSVDQDGDLPSIRRELESTVLPRLRESLDLDDLPVTLEFRFSTKTGTARIV